MQIRDSVVLVTGANRGIGRAIVGELLDRAVKKVYAAARDPKSLGPVVALDPARVKALRLDITDGAQVKSAAREAGDVGILINNAGVATFGSFLESGEDAIRKDMEVNYFATLAISKAFAPALIERKGALVNLLSIVSLVSFPGIGGYSASKAAAFSLTQGLRLELGAHGVRVLGVHPGPVDTDMASDLDMEKASPESVARAIADGIEADEEHIYPDAMAREVGATWSKDPRALEAQMASMAH